MIFFIFVATVPVFFGSVFTLTYFNTSILKSSKRNIEDKLHTALLIYGKKRSEIEKINRTAANDNIVIINFELLLYPPISNHLKSIIKSGNLSFLSILDLNGRLIISGNKTYFNPPEIPVFGNDVLNKSVRDNSNIFATKIASRELLEIEELNEESREDIYAIICISPIYSYNKDLLGYMTAGYILNSNKYPNNFTIMDEIRKNIDSNVILMENNRPFVYSEGNLKNDSFIFPGTFTNSNGEINTNDFQSITINSQSYIYKFSPLSESSESLKIHIGIGISENKFYALRNQSAFFFGIITILSIVIAVIIAYFLSKSITSPVLSIVEGTKNIIQGDFNKNIEVKTNDEIGILAGSFNIMTQKLSHRIEMENIVTDISKKFINLPVSEIDGEINKAIDRISNYVSADICRIYDISGDKKSIKRIQEWKRIDAGYASNNDINIDVENYPWLMNEIQSLDSIHISSIDTLPIEAEKEKSLWMGMGIKSIIVVPMFFGEKLKGFKIFKFISKIDEISDEDIQLIRLVTEIICNALERQKSELILTNARNYFKNLFNAQSSILISINPSGAIIEWNSSAEQFTGISVDEAASLSIWETIPFLNEYKKRAQMVIETFEPQSILREVVEFNGKKNLDISFFPLAFVKNSDVVIRIDDKTEFEKKNEQLLQMQKMETVGTLAGGIAHDFNNILTAIIGTVSILKFQYEKGDINAHIFKKYIETITSSSERAADLVKQLLNLSRKIEPKLKRIDLNILVKNVLKIAENTFDKSIELSVKYYNGSAFIYADQTQIEQSLLNICVNAAHSMTIMRKEDERQGGLLDLEIKKLLADHHFCSALPEAKAGNEYFLIKISDTGTGMNRETMSKIFDPFFTTKGEGKGTGLGLAMTYNIFKEHNGFINVYSDEGTGSTFNLYLPAHEKIIETADNPDDKGIFLKGSGLVLIIDDEKAVRETAGSILKECGYEVIYAENEFIGVEIFNKMRQKINAVVLDLAMPKMSGKETYIKIKEIDPKSKVIITSGFKQDVSVQQLIEMGVSSYLQKPFTMNELAKAVYQTIYSKTGIIA